MLPHKLHISGPARECGRQYGEGLRAAILERDAKWKAHLGRHSGMAPERFIADHLENSSYLPAAEYWTPDLLEEVRGIAEGAGLSFEHAFAAQLMDEEWLFWESFRGNHHCSSLASADPAAGIAFAAQNMDLPNWMDGSQTVLHITDSVAGLRSIVLTAAGMIGLTGVNDAGLAIAVNTLSQLPSAIDGLPVAFVTRGLLQRRDAAGARHFLHSIKHAAGQNYLICDAATAEDHECSAEGKNAFVPAASRGNAVWHTNHPLAGGQAVHAMELSATGGEANSRTRMAAMDARLAASGGAWDLATARAVLASRDDPACPIARPLVPGDTDHGFTFASVIWEVAPAPRAHVAPGPPDRTPYSTFDFG